MTHATPETGAGRRRLGTEKPPTDGALVCRWIEANLVHAEGDHFGRPFKLHPFQRKFLYRLSERRQDDRMARRRKGH